MNNPPLDFLLLCSQASLEDFELSRLNRIANIRKQLHALQDELRQVEVEAALGQWLLLHREQLLAAGRALAFQSSFQFNSPMPSSLPAVAPVMGAKAARWWPGRSERR
jgi:hypothetical protein